MEIVIDIPQGLKIDFENENWTALTCAEMKNALIHGTPLPKGHGALKDVSKIHLEKFVNCKNYSLHPLYSEDFKRGYNSAIDDVWNVLREAQVIVEPDKEAEE